ncbi:hypothetical protein psal_cds_1385 [Pandoravirus salinus]|uniref:Uncharacterized protein n=1 Tax=Pandoravirus salinus TaxID=1349410 RepID=A0A291ATV0_9VIRU|nr:hypothetical protein psal_cds_1385 [Pandoravirus salinus]ATE82313.1 hypothetical protein psal_cds_1385 [Pandoravirus salinus]
MDPPPVDVLPDDLLYLIVSDHVRDPKDLGACLLAWRRFHVLTSTDMTVRRCRFATLLSLCAAGDRDGLRYAALRPDVFGPVAGFRWDACLYVAVIGNHADVLQHLKARMVEVASTLPPAPDLDPEPPAHTTADQRVAMHLALENGAINSPTWPPAPAPWLALAVTAAHHGCERALAWLCDDDNRPTRAPTIGCVLSAYATVRMASVNRADELLWLTMRLDLEVVLAVMRTAHTMDRAAMHAVAERVSAASGFDIVGLLQQSTESVDNDTGGAVSHLQWLEKRLGWPKWADPADDQLAHKAMADPLTASVDGVNAAWALVARGGLTALRDRYGDAAVGMTLDRSPFYPVQVLAVSMAVIAPHAGLRGTDAINISPPWPSVCDDVMWLHARVKRDVDGGAVAPLLCSVVVPFLRVAMALAGRRDLMDELGAETESGDDQAASFGHGLTSFLGFMYPRVAVAAVGRGDLDTARWACARMGEGDAYAAWSAWREGNADAARFLYARGCERASQFDRLRSDTYTKSPLYASLCARDTEAVSFLLDPTAADDSCRSAVDRAISAAVAVAASEALAFGDLRAVLWLRRRYSGIVDEVIGEARTTRTPSLAPTRTDPQKA